MIIFLKNWINHPEKSHIHIRFTAGSCVNNFNKVINIDDKYKADVFILTLKLFGYCNFFCVDVLSLQGKFYRCK